MVLNVLNVPGQIIATGSAIVILLVFCITFSPLVYRPRVPPGSAGGRATPGEKEAHEAKGQAQGGEVVRADGYIDSFAGLVTEAGGSLPLIASVFSIGCLIWWAAYLVLLWNEPYAPIRVFWR
jgi:hypothetical protein